MYLTDYKTVYRYSRPWNEYMGLYSIRAAKSLKKWLLDCLVIVFKSISRIFLQDWDETKSWQRAALDLCLALIVIQWWGVLNHAKPTAKCKINLKMGISYEPNIHFLAEQWKLLV